MSKIEQMLEDINEANGCYGGITLSDWEEEFVESIENFDGTTG